MSEKITVQGDKEALKILLTKYFGCDLIGFKYIIKYLITIIFCVLLIVLGKIIGFKISDISNLIRILLILVPIWIFRFILDRKLEPINDGNRPKHYSGKLSYYYNTEILISDLKESLRKPIPDFPFKKMCQIGENFSINGDNEEKECQLLSQFDQRSLIQILIEKNKIIGLCMVCQLPIHITEEILKCPRCITLAHTSHLLEWIKVKGSCPNCGASLNNRYFLNEDKEALKSLQEEIHCTKKSKRVFLCKI